VIEDYRSMNLAELKSAANDRGLAKTGRKQVLVERLLGDDKRRVDQAFDHVGAASEAPQTFRYILVRALQQVKCRRTACREKVQKGEALILDTHHTYSKGGENIVRRSAYYFHVDCCRGFFTPSTACEYSPNAKDALKRTDE
jgi:hypothetical protein